MTKELDKIMGKPIQYVKPQVVEARLKAHIKDIDNESFTEGLSHVSTVSKLKLLKEKCDADDEIACDVYSIAVEGNGSNNTGLRQMWEQDGNLEAKRILEELDEL